MENVKLKAIYGELNIDCFIIPNKASVINSSYFLGEKLMNRSKELSELNGFMYNPETTKMVQIWSVGQHSDNMQDHGFKYCVGSKGEGLKEFCFMFDSYLPETVFESYQEGDIVTLKMPFKPRYVFTKDEGCKKLRDGSEDFEDDQNIPEAPQFIFTVNIKLNQREYRYKNFGNFEEVLNTVTFH